MSASNRKLPKIDSWADFLNGLDQHDEHGTLQLPGMESFEPANDCVNSKEQVSWSQSHTLVNLFMRRAGKPSLLPESVNAQIPVPSHNTINGPSGSDAKLAPPGNVPRSSSGPATFPLDRTAATKRSREDIQSRHLTETPSVPETRSMTTAVPSPSYFATMQNKRHKSEPPRKPAGQGMTMTHDQIVTQYGRLVQKHAQLESDHKKIVLNLTTQSGKMLRLKTTMARQLQKSRIEAEKLKESLRLEKKKTAMLEEQNRELSRKHDVLKWEKEEEVSKLRTFLKLAKSRIEIERRTLANGK